MDAKEVMERIANLPGEWRHPDAEVFAIYATKAGASPDHLQKLCMDLELRHIAEKLASIGKTIERAEASDGSEVWVVYGYPSKCWAKQPTYALALISAAEEASRG